MCISIERDGIVWNSGQEPRERVGYFSCNIIRLYIAVPSAHMAASQEIFGDLNAGLGGCCTPRARAHRSGSDLGFWFGGYRCKLPADLFRVDCTWNAWVFFYTFRVQCAISALPYGNFGHVAGWCFRNSIARNTFLLFVYYFIGWLILYF